MLRYAVLALALLGAACASGNSLVTGVARAPISPESVRVYSTAPEHYEEVAILQAQGRDVSSQTSLNRAVDELRRRAAALGANGVIVETVNAGHDPVVGSFANGFGSVSGGGTNPRIQEVRARAIFVPNE